MSDQVEEKVPSLLNRSQLAKVLNISVMTIRRWDENGCPNYLIGFNEKPRGKRYRYDAKEVLCWLRGRQEQAIVNTHPTL